jgi:hypothetical protein
MTTDIIGVNAAPGAVTFIVITDAQGCDEQFSTMIEGQKFATPANVILVGAGPHPNQSIPHTKTGSGNHEITVCAETSNVCSEPTPVTL